MGTLQNKLKYLQSLKPRINKALNRVDDILDVKSPNTFKQNNMIDKLVNKAVNKATNGRGLKRDYSVEKKALQMYKGKYTDQETLKEIKDLAVKIVHKTNRGLKSKTPDTDS